MRHLNTLVALICGIAGAHHVHLSKMADHAPGHGILQQSLIMRLRRWLQNRNVTWETYMLPVARELPQALAHEPLVLDYRGAPLYGGDDERGLWAPRTAPGLGGATPYPKGLLTHFTCAPDGLTV